MCAVLGGLYLAVVLIPATRGFFALTVPDLQMMAMAAIGTAIAIGALALCGYPIGSQPAEGSAQ
jgi:hypothetical protein